MRHGMPTENDTTSDDNTPNGEVLGGDFGGRLRKLEVSDIELETAMADMRAYIDAKHEESNHGRAAVEERLGAKIDVLVAAHNASPVKRTFDILEKMASPTVGMFLLANVLVVLLWVTDLPFEGAGYKIGRVAAAANEDSDQGDMPASVSGAVEPTE
jgi:hypothetical protein